MSQPRQAAGMPATEGAALPSSKDDVQPPNSTVRPAILRLPRELRDLIYEHYVRIEGGYTYDYASNKLREPDGRPVSIALTASCRQIAYELRGLPFSYNAITFSTYFSDSTNKDAGVFHSTVESVSLAKRGLIRHLIPLLLTEDMAQEASQAFPQFEQIFDEWEPGRSIDALRNWDFTGGEARSVWEDFKQLILTLLSRHPKFLQVLETLSDLHTRRKGCKVPGLRNACLEPWSIPDIVEMERLADIVNVEPERPDYWSSTRYCFSAVHAALRFLQSIPATTCEMIRKVILLEDRPSVAYPQCHGRGLIPFCQTHKELCFERIVDLWRKAFPVSTRAMYDYIRKSQNGDDANTMSEDRLISGTISDAIGSWMTEAQALQDLGMPEGSHTLVFNGAPNPEQASRAFQVVQRDAAWQVALDVAYTKGTLPHHTWSERRLKTGYITECFPDVVQSLSKKDAPIRCNFSLGTPYSPKKLGQDHRGWDDDNWESRWNSYDQAKFQTEPPLPPWHILRWGYVLTR